jgi:hypothetical protein
MTPEQRKWPTLLQLTEDQLEVLENLRMLRARSDQCNRFPTIDNAAMLWRIQRLASFRYGDQACEDRLG